MSIESMTVLIHLMDVYSSQKGQRMHDMHVY